jgi:hypothetical protein
MKKILVIVFMWLLIATNSWAVVVTGTGTTRDEAIRDGLRKAVEMYAGSFVYAVTDVENYTLKLDQIVATSVGFAKSYRIIKESVMDSLIVIPMDVTISEDKIESVVRNNVNLVTYEDVIRDYNNVTHRQEQMKKLVEMFKLLASRPIREKYNIAYEGYQIKNITTTKVDVYLTVRITINPYYNKLYNEILKNLSVNESSGSTLGVGGNYRFEGGQLVNNAYIIDSKELNARTLDDINVQAFVNGKAIGKCRPYRDNLMVNFSVVSFVTNFATLFPKMMYQKLSTDEEDVEPGSKDRKPINMKKYNNAAIKNSKLFTPNGVSLVYRYSFTNPEQIKSLSALKFTLERCKNREHNHFYY